MASKSVPQNELHGNHRHVNGQSEGICDMDQADDNLQSLFDINDAEQYKVFNDPIHGHIELHPLCVKIIDTIQFQRLRFLKQLGACYFVFPGASHNRFEHSLGVCHLAGQVVRSLRDKQQELDITDRDVLCVEIAGLCHDLGHGPFSHMFDAIFIPTVRKNVQWKHEDASIEMLNHLIESNDLKKEFKKYQLKFQDEKEDNDIEFIKELIQGKKLSKAEGQQKKIWPYKGRGEKKRFLYEIVSNERNGIDVDKWDYFARDCHMLGMKSNFDHLRLIKFARVMEVNGEWQICYRDKEVHNVYEMFHTRMTLHRRAYQHRVNRIIETMITEALILADPHLVVGKDRDGKQMHLSTAIDNMEIYSMLTDDVFWQIMHCDNKNLDEAKGILSKILKRDLYKFIGETMTKKKPQNKKEKDMMRREIYERCDIQKAKTMLDESDLIVDIVSMDYGMKGNNPVDHVKFYDRIYTSVEVRKSEVSQTLPENFNDIYVRLYCKKKDLEVLEIVKNSFTSWCDQRKLPLPKGRSFEMTPCKIQQESPDGAPPIKKRHVEGAKKELSYDK